MKEILVDVVATCPNHGSIGIDRTTMLCGKRWCSECLIEALEDMGVAEVEMARVEDSACQNGHTS